MITFKYSQERDIVFYYAGKLNDHLAAEIFANEVVIDKEAALYLSKFFWRMLDSSIKCTEENSYPWGKGAEFWNEKILNSISGSLKQLGLLAIWDAVADEQ